MPAQYTNGVPTNLEASANDALTWLEFFEDKARRDKGCRISMSNLEKLQLAIKLLRQFLPDAEPEFTETKQQEPTCQKIFPTN